MIKLSSDINYIIMGRRIVLKINKELKICAFWPTISYLSVLIIETQTFSQGRVGGNCVSDYLYTS